MFDNIDQISDAIGLVGVAITLIAYILLNLRKITSDSYWYPGMNALGSAMILFSIYFAWNLAAWVMEFCWLFISIYGVVEFFLRRRRRV